MTVEEQRYLEECKKVLKREQMDIITMAMDYGLLIADIRKVVQSNQSAECMREIIYGMMEGIGEEVAAFLCENDFNQYQMKEIREGIAHGLTFEQVKTYGTKEMSANRMKKMRKQLEEAIPKKNGQTEDDSVRDYMKGLMEIMENTIRQFKESNERFECLSSLVKEHVVDEKNREIKDLYENLKYKDKSIQELQQKVADRDKVITDLQESLAKKGDEFSMEKIEVEPAQSFKKRMSRWFAVRDNKIPKDVFGEIMEAELSTEQMEEVRQCMEHGLTDQDISRVIANAPTPEKMRKMREILLLMKKRKEGTENVH